MIGLMCLKESISKESIVHVNLFFVITNAFLEWILDFNQNHMMVVILQCNRQWVLIILRLLLLKKIIPEVILVYE